MKEVRFVTKLVPLILNGTKTSTWRLWDDKDLRKGDKVAFVNAATDDMFAIAVLERVYQKTFNELTDREREGHEPFGSDAEMYRTYQQYYGRNVEPGTVVKVVRFKLLSSIEDTAQQP